MNPDECEQALLTGIEKIDPVLNPLGFVFKFSGVSESHPVLSAIGFYVNGSKNLGLIYRAGVGLGAVIYEYQKISIPDDEFISISHDELMRYLGKHKVNKLKYSNFKFASFAKGGGDAFEALAYDLQNFALEFLNGSDSEFRGVLQKASSSQEAASDRKQSVGKLTGAILGSLIYGVLIGGGIAGLFDNLLLGMIIGIGVCLTIIALGIRNRKSKE